MAFDGFLNMPGITGECTEDAHQGWIGVLSFSEALARAFTAQGDESTNVSFSDFTFTKYIDTSTPTLRHGCCAGTQYPEVTFELCQTSGDKHKYLEIKLSNALIASIACAGAGGQAEGLPTESVSLRFYKIEWTYSPMGDSSGVVSAEYDLSISETV
jgi:type VI secretion system secreted protein Hcp